MRDARGAQQGARRLGRRALATATAVALAAATGLVVPATIAAATATSPPSTIHTGTKLVAGTELRSANGEYRLWMQRDGNLVEYEGKAVRWASGTGGHPGADADLQRDGNFVIYDHQTVLFATGTERRGSTGNTMVLRNDGDLVIYDSAHKVLWGTVQATPLLGLGATGSAVKRLQERLTELHYWNGSVSGVFGDATQQALWALEKAAGIARTGETDEATWSALERGVEPHVRKASGNLIEVNLATDLLMIIRDGKLYATLNTSTGGGYTYVEDGQTGVATTPQGVFHIYYVIDGTDTDPLGTLWRPRFFVSGYAIHGDNYVPPEPVSHGCVRVSDEAINWIWAENLAPIGEEVWVY